MPIFVCLLAWPRVQSSGYAYPFEIHHSSFLGSDVPPYWIRFKGGARPGYFATIALIPEIKTGTLLTPRVPR